LPEAFSLARVKHGTPVALFAVIRRVSCVNLQLSRQKQTFLWKTDDRLRIHLNMSHPEIAL